MGHCRTSPLASAPTLPLTRRHRLRSAGISAACALWCAATSNAWAAGCLCTSVQRHQQPETLLLSCTPTTAVPAATDAAFKQLLTDMGIDAQVFWQSSRQATEMRAVGRVQRLSFYVLPRIADTAALTALIERVHRKHTLFGGLVSVQGPNMPQLMRCSECHTLGHSPAACPIFGGTAVRLLFKSPLAPAALLKLVQLLDAQSAMLGNSHAQDEWRSAHKATLFFHLDVQSPAAVQRFADKMQQLVLECDHLLHQPPHLVDMTMAARKKECSLCGNREREHLCLCRGGPAQRPSVQHTDCSSSHSNSNPCRLLLAEQLLLLVQSRLLRRQLAHWTLHAASQHRCVHTRRMQEAASG